MFNCLPFKISGKSKSKGKGKGKKKTMKDRLAESENDENKV